MGELVEVGQGDHSGLHAAHGEAGHGPMGLIGEGAVVGINEGDQVIDEDPLESVKLKLRAAAPAGAPPRPPGAPPVRDRRHRPDVAVCHHDDEGPGFAIGNQVVHDQVGMALIAPAGLIFAHAMLQIQRRVALGGVLIIIRGRINEAAGIGLAVLGDSRGSPAVGHGARS